MILQHSHVNHLPLGSPTEIVKRQEKKKSDFHHLYSPPSQPPLSNFLCLLHLGTKEEEVLFQGASFWQ